VSRVPGHRNAPVEVHWEEASGRLLNLAIALLNQRTPRSLGWIADNVEGYGGNSDSADTVRKRFGRDRQILADLGIRVVESEVHDDDNHPGTGYSVERSASFLPEITFTPGEWDAVTAASRWALTDSQSRQVRSAFTKLAAAARRESTGAPGPVVGEVPDTLDLGGDDVEAINRALDRGLALEFRYWPTPLAEPQDRRMDPWALAARDGKLFLTGHDLERDGQRTFRLSRLTDVAVLQQFITHDRPAGSPRALVADGLAAAATETTARVLFTTDGAHELRALAADTAEGATAEPDPRGTVLTLGPVDRDRLVRLAAAYAPDALVLDPPEVVDAVVTLLRHADDIYGGQRG
jgi:proteasome accessory factor B